jgi:hypothetical protein
MNVAFKLGDTIVHAVVHQNKRPVPTMLNVHDDENTSVHAGLDDIARHGGRVIELVYSGQRLITFSLDGKEFSFDPNRIFSDAGIAATLEKHCTYSTDAHAAIKSFADEYLSHFALDREPVIIALHNTVDGIFSVDSFGAKGNHSYDAAATHVSPRRSKFDFFYVTERRFYDFLKEREFNVVLQDNEHVTEDGSLSVYFSRKGIPYINVEAEISHLEEQIEMLNFVRQMLGTWSSAEIGIVV